MNIVTLFITHTQSPLIEQPIKRGFHHVAKFTQTAAVFRIAFGNQRFGLAMPQRLANFLLGIIGASVTSGYRFVPDIISEEPLHNL